VARLYYKQGKDNFATPHMQEAFYGYVRWGAGAKSEQIKRHPGQILTTGLQPADTATNGPAPDSRVASYGVIHTRANSETTQSINAALDQQAIFKASQAIASNIDLSVLITEVTQIILQNSGGDRCALILPNETGTWQVRAIATAEETRLCAESFTDNLNVPAKLIQYVKNTQDIVVIDDLETPLPVIDDYLRQHQPKSVLGMPVLNQGRCIGMIALENRLTGGVFTEDRLVILDFLCTQAAISIQNSLLYQELEHSLQQAQTTSQELAETVALSKGQQHILALIAQGLTLTEILAEVALYIESQSHHRAYCSFLILEDGERLRHGAAPSLPAAYSALIDGIGIGPDVGSCGTAAYCKATVTVTDIATDPLWANFKKIASDFGLGACASTPILGGDGQVLATLAMYQPTAGEYTLHDRQLMEVATYLARIAIERHYADLELQQLNLQLIQDEKMVSLGNLVAGVAHEINNPLGFLNGSVSNAEDYLQDCFEHIALYQKHYPSPEVAIQNHGEEIDLDFLLDDLPKMLGTMRGAIDRIKKISNSLRIFSRADSESKSLVNLHEGLDSTLLILKYRLKGNERRPEIRIETDYGEIPEISCFPSQLNQVFMNILANAIDALDDASEHRSFEEIEAQPHRIIVRTFLEDDRVNVAISDNGPGIPDDVKAHIFDHLFTTKGIGKGTGLGLAIARQIIEETHGGTLGVQSEVGQGAEFCLRLPCSIGTSVEY
ncbi:MAG: GAF domain-containing protein, partial [Cyanobacteria bacterium J06642_11]